MNSYQALESLIISMRDSIHKRLDEIEGKLSNREKASARGKDLKKIRMMSSDEYEQYVRDKMKNAWKVSSDVWSDAYPDLDLVVEAKKFINWTCKLTRQSRPMKIKSRFVKWLDNAQEWHKKRGGSSKKRGGSRREDDKPPVYRNGERVT